MYSYIAAFLFELLCCRQFCQRTGQYKNHALRGCLCIKLSHCLHDVTMTSPCFVLNKLLLPSSNRSITQKMKIIKKKRRHEEAKNATEFTWEFATLSSLCLKFWPATETSGDCEMNDNNLMCSVLSFEFGSNVSVIDDPNFAVSSIIQEWRIILLMDQSVCKETVRGLNYLLSPSCEW